MARGAAGGVIGSGGSADLDAISTHTVGGAEHVCVPISGRMVSSGPDMSISDVETAAAHAADLHESLATQLRCLDGPDGVARTIVRWIASS